MKNGTLFNRLVLVDSSNQSLNGQDFADDSESDYAFHSDANIHSTGTDSRTMLFVFMAVSIACTTAAIAAGTYAVWLSRQRVAHRALTDVNDILKTCQARMRQLESEVQKLPGRAV